MDIAWLKRYGFIVIFIILAMAFFFASGVAKASGNPHRPTCQGAKCSVTSNSTSNASANVQVDGSFLSAGDYDATPATAYAPATAPCLAGLGLQGMKGGLSTTMTQRQCVKLIQAREDLRLANSLECTAPDKVGKGGDIEIGNRCLAMKKTLMEQAFKNHQDANEEANRRPGVLQTIWNVFGFN